MEYSLVWMPFAIVISTNLANFKYQVSQFEQEDYYNCPNNRPGNIQYQYLNKTITLNKAHKENVKLTSYL